MVIHARGMCRSCYGAWLRSKTAFGGLRLQALIRDGKQCVCCGELSRRQILVHHRRPGHNALRLFITLCRRCHVRIHHTRRPRYGMPAFLRDLWRELHCGWPEQRELPLDTAAVERGRPYSQPGLFEAA